MYSVQRYSSEYFDVWNNFVTNSKNGTFLFHRDFMEYHADRFTDYSLMVYDGNKLVALLPANIADNVVHSHQGLTYGGILFASQVSFDKARLVFNSLVRFMLNEGILTLIIKQIPQMYHKMPSFEMDFLLYKAGASIKRKDLNLAVDYSAEKWISKSKLKHYRRRADIGFEIKKEQSFEAFWQHVLVPRLKTKHNAAPVHNVNEITMLAKRFPDNIIQYNIYKENVLLAGLTLFISDKVVKSQYGATTKAGEELRALDYLFISVLEKYRSEMHYFDMGTVMERDGSINYGLVTQKEELACSTYTQDIIELQLSEQCIINP